MVFRFFKWPLIAKKNEVKYSRTCFMFIFKCDDGSNKFLASKITNLLKKIIASKDVSSRDQKCNASYILEMTKIIGEFERVGL